MASVTALVHLRRIPREPLRTILAVVAVAAGVALLSGVTMARSSVRASMEGYTSGLSGAASWRVQGPADHGSIDDGLPARIAAVPGVAAAVPVVVARAVATDEQGDERFVSALGVDCAVEAIIGPFGCTESSVALAGGSAVVLGRSLAAELGPNGSLRTTGGEVAAADATVLPALDAFNGGRISIWSLADAQDRFSRRGRVDTVLVTAEPGVDLATVRAGVERVVGPANRVLAADSPYESSGAVDQLMLGLLLASLLGLTVGSQLVQNTLLLSFEERREELALLGAVGAGPRRIARGVLAEAAALGIAGGLLGAVFGVLVARTFVSSLSAQTERLAGVHIALDVAVVDIAIAIVVGILAAVAAAVVPARRAARLDLAGELAGRQRHDPHASRYGWRSVALIAGTLAGLAACWLGGRDGSLETWQPAAAVGGMVVAAGCAFRLPGSVAPLVLATLHRWAERRTGTLRIALGNLSGDPPRTRSIAGALGAAVSIAVTLGALVPSIEAGGRADAAQVGDVVTVSAVPLNNGSGIDAKLSAADDAALAALPGVAEVRGVYNAELRHPTIGYVHVQSEDGPPPTYAVHRGEGAAASFAAGRVMVGPALARSKGLAPGDRLQVPGVDGFTDLTVGGIWAAPDGLGRSLSVRRDQFDALVGARPPTSVGLVPEPGVTTTDLAARVAALGLGSHVLVLTPQELSDALAIEFRAFAEPFRALQYGLLVVAFTATASTLLLSAVQRRREHALLGAVGMPPRGLGAMTITEAAILAVVAIASGTVAGMVGAIAFAYASAVLTGLAIAVPVSVAALPPIALAVMVIAVGAAVAPALRTSRIDPALALRHE